MPPSRKVGAPKTKGSVRAKSGCYTCRIRRKKCDEVPNASGDCRTCVRLHLECLGFGPKRPEWLRESHRVVKLRQKIKTFLGSQGMIKGTSGSGPRSPDQGPPILRLYMADDSSSCSSRSSTPVLSADTRPVPVTSAERDQPNMLLSYNSPSVMHTMDHLDPGSPYAHSHAQLYPQDDLVPAFTPMTDSRTIAHDLTPWMTSPMYPPQHYPSLALGSNFSRHHAMGITYPDEDPNDIINPLSPEYTSIPLLHPSSDDLVTYYMEHVLKIQFLLMDQPWLQYMMHDCISRSTTAFVAVRLLAELHRWCLQNKGLRGNPDIVSRRKALFHELTTTMYGPGSDGRGEAVAALQLVSSYLFVGGSGEWQSSLGLSCEYAKAVLRSSAYANASDALLKCHHIQRFVIKTSMWFDVLASASQLTRPCFLEEYRELFDPSNAHFDAPPPEELDMIAVMGCSNRIVWAMAEITNLACWKANSHAQGRPSTVGLMEKANDIQKFLMIRGRISKLTGRDDVQGLRDLTSEVFRSSALVYLHSVISGDYPSCPEIQMNVHNTIKLLELIPDMSETMRSVTRCVVFCIFICGCLTGDKNQRDYLINRLAQQNDKPVGNCSRVQSLLKEVWDEWDRDPRQPVRWRKVLKDPSMLLV